VATAINLFHKHDEAVMHCEIIRTLASQPEDFETGAVAPELSVTYRIFWSVDGGIDIEWEPLRWTMGQTEGQNFSNLYGAYFKEWCRNDFEKSRDFIEHEAEEFSPFRDFYLQQAAGDRSIHRQSVL